MKGRDANVVQKEIGLKKKVALTIPYAPGPGLTKKQAKEDASELLAKKIQLEAEKKELEAIADAKEKEMNKKLGTIGNIVHNSVPVSDNEVCFLPPTRLGFC
jgi:seryl-tRNA synthetase